MNVLMVLLQILYLNTYETTYSTSGYFYFIARCHFYVSNSLLLRSVMYKNIGYKQIEREVLTKAQLLPMLNIYHLNLQGEKILLLTRGRMSHKREI